MADERFWRNWYSGRRWRRLRAQQLAIEPCCRLCAARNRVTPATVVDHIKPHKGDKSLFYSPENLQSLCKRCHDAVKQALEKTGSLRGCGTDGTPLDPRHHWR